MSISLDFIPQRSLAVEVVDRLREAILKGVFKPGELLNQVQIAAQFGTSRGPVRMALSKLEEEGLVTNVPRRGTFVTMLDRKQVQDLYGLRVVLEAYAAQLAVPNLTPENFANFKSLVQEMQQAAREGNPARVIEVDLMLHQYLIERSGNSLLQQAWSNIQVQVRRCLAIRHHGYHNLEEIADSHLPLIEMLRHKNVEGTARVITEHTTDAVNHLMSNWQPSQES